MNRLSPPMFAALLLLALFPAACSMQPLPDDAPTLNPASLGSNQDPEAAAIGAASWAMADPSRTANNPIAAARGVASVDYLAGDLFANPRWNGMDPIWKDKMLKARVETRAAVGIAPDSRSQAVVNALLAVADALATNNPAAAQVALASPLFTFGPQRTLAALTNLPPLPTANVATARVAESAFGGRGACPGCG